MVLVDPLFQRQLVAQCRERAIPVIFDEVLPSPHLCCLTSSPAPVLMQLCYQTSALLQAPVALTYASPLVLPVWHGCPIDLVSAVALAATPFESSVSPHCQ